MRGRRLTCSWGLAALVTSAGASCGQGIWLKGPNRTKCMLGSGKGMFSVSNLGWVRRYARLSPGAVSAVACLRVGTDDCLGKSSGLQPEGYEVR